MQLICAGRLRLISRHCSSCNLVMTAPLRLDWRKIYASHLSEARKRRTSEKPETRVRKCLHETAGQTTLREDRQSQIHAAAPPCGHSARMAACAGEYSRTKSTACL